MILKFESREFPFEGYSQLWRLTVDSETRKCVGVLYGISTNDGEVVKANVNPYQFQWEKCISLETIIRHYEERFFSCERFTPIKGLKRSLSTK